MLAGFVILLLQLAPMLLMYAAMILFMVMMGNFADGPRGGGRDWAVDGGSTAPGADHVAVYGIHDGDDVHRRLCLDAVDRHANDVRAAAGGRPGCGFSAAFRTSWDATRTDSGSWRS